MNFPIFQSPCLSKDEILADIIDRDQNKNSNNTSRNLVHWIPPPAKTTKVTPSVRRVKYARLNSNRRSRSWGQSDKDDIETENDVVDAGKNGGNWTEVRHWVNNLDKSIENLSNNVRNLLKNETEIDNEPILLPRTPRKEKDETNKADDQPIRFHHTPVKDCTPYENEVITCQHSSVKENNNRSPSVDRLNDELRRARDQLQQAETKQASLEALKSHLQLQLRHRSSQCERLTTQMRNSASKSRQTVVQLTQELAAADARIQELERQRDLLKHAAKGQKRRAMKAEAEIARLRREEREEKREENHNSENSTVKALTQLEEDNKRLRDLASSYEDRLALTEKEIEKLRERLAHTEAQITQTASHVQTKETADLPKRPQSSTPAPSDNPDDAAAASASAQVEATPNAPSTYQQELERTVLQLRDQLAQSNASNRSLQAYLAFLKHSYCSIFEAGGDVEKDLVMTKEPPKVDSVVTPEVLTSTNE